MNILVTGGLGYIGSHAVVALVKAGYRPIVLDNLSNSLIQVQDRLQQITRKTIPCYHFDVRDKEALDDLIREEEIDAVMHFAAYLQVNESVQNPLKYFSNNIDGCISVLDVCHTHKLPLVFSSSCTVYGNPEKLPVDELAPIKRAESPYGQTKIICEQMIEDMCRFKGLQAINLRYFNPIGAHETGLIGELQFGEPHHLVPYITETAKGIRKELKVFGSDYDTKDGTCVRDYIHVMDLAEAHVKALEYIRKSDASTLEQVNIGTGTGATVLEVIQAFEQATGVKINYTIAERRPGDVEAIYASADKARNLLNWTARRPLEQALTDAWNWEQKSMNFGKNKN